MKTLTLLLISMTCLFVFGCSEKEQEPGASSETGLMSENVVDVTATHDHEENLHLFTMDRKEIRPGWITFQFRNLSDSDHFFMIYKVPEEGIEAAEAANQPLLEHWYESVTVPFQDEYNPYIEGEVEYSVFVENLLGSVSEKGPWFFDPGAPPMGGVGLTAISQTSRTTVNLEPGEYIVECYVKDENEVFHSYIGMLEHFTVSGEPLSAAEPEADVSVTVSSETGITVEGDLTTGEQVVEVYYEDQTTYDHLLGHNVQLAKLEDKENQNVLSELATWLDWRQPGSLMVSAPEGVEFLGGVMEMTGGSKAYLHLDLEPGDYAWVAEVPDPASHNMLITFSLGE